VRYEFGRVAADFSSSAGGGGRNTSLLWGRSHDGWPLFLSVAGLQQLEKLGPAVSNCPSRGRQFTLGFGAPKRGTFCKRGRLPPHRRRPRSLLGARDGRPSSFIGTKQKLRFFRRRCLGALLKTKKDSDDPLGSESKFVLAKKPSTQEGKSTASS
jgi:hypothetical protein